MAHQSHFYSLVSATKKSAAARAGRAGGGIGRSLVSRLAPARPPTEGGASAEVSVTQSCGDETPGGTAKRTDGLLTREL